MAKAMTKKADIVYVLELTEREANALTELLCATNGFEGEGDFLDGIYCQLCEVGAESEKLSHRIEGNQVIVTRSGA